MKKIRFQGKIIISNILLISIVLIMLVGYFYYYMMDMVNKQMTQDFRAMTSKTLNQVNNLIYDMDETALLIAANPTIVSIFSRIEGHEDTNYFHVEPTVSKPIVRLLSSYNLKKNPHLRICLYNKSSDYLYTGISPIAYDAMMTYFHSDAFQELMTYFHIPEHFFMFTPPGEDTWVGDSPTYAAHIFSVIREIKDYTMNSEEWGYVEVQESKSALDHIFRSMGDDYMVGLLDKEGNMIYSHNLDNSLSLDSVLEALGKTNHKDTPYRIKTYMAYRAFLEEIPYQVVFIRDYSKISHSLLGFRTYIIIAFLVVITIVIFAERGIIKHLSRPLMRLYNSIKQVDIDHLQLEMVDMNHSDEISQLGEAFNMMLAHLEEAIEDRVHSQTNEHRAQIFALQSQINPHFMHNILAIISIEAQGYNEKIVNMCAKLSKMFIYASHMGNGYSSLEDEVAYAVNYLSLMKERYEDSFTFSVNMEEGLRTKQVPKLILQPLCENCFTHAFKEIEPLWQVHIRAYQEEDRWLLEVKDNGLGFRPEALDKIRDLEASYVYDRTQEHLRNIAIGGLCLQNIYIRLRLIYKEKMVFQISQGEWGTKVILGGEIGD